MDHVRGLSSFKHVTSWICLLCRHNAHRKRWSELAGACRRSLQLHDNHHVQLGRRSSHRCVRCSGFSPLLILRGCSGRRFAEPANRRSARVHCGFRTALPWHPESRLHPAVRRAVQRVAPQPALGQPLPFFVLAATAAVFTPHSCVNECVR